MIPIETNKFTIRFTTFKDPMLFNIQCIKFQEFITYSVGNKSVDGKCIKALCELPINQIATVSIDTENPRIIDEFIECIQPWLITS